MEQTKDSGIEAKPLTDLCDVEANVIYVMAEGIDRLIYDIERRLAMKGQGFRHEKKRAFNELVRSLRRAHTLCDMLDDDIIHASSDGRAYDQWGEDTLELCRLILLFCDKCSYNAANNAAVFKTLKEMSGGLGLVKEVDLERFTQK